MPHPKSTSKRHGDGASVFPTRAPWGQVQGHTKAGLSSGKGARGVAGMRKYRMQHSPLQCAICGNTHPISRMKAMLPRPVRFQGASRLPACTTAKRDKRSTLGSGSVLPRCRLQPKLLGHAGKVLKPSPLVRNMGCLQAMYHQGEMPTDLEDL